MTQQILPQHGVGVIVYTAYTHTHTQTDPYTHIHTPQLASCHSMQMWIKQKVYERIFFTKWKTSFLGR